MGLVVGGAVAFAIAGILLFLRRGQRDRLLEIKATRTSTARELAELSRDVADSMGQAGAFNQVSEVKGVVQCDSPLTSEISKQPCAYYSMTVSRRYQETYHEHDSQTNRQVRRTREGEESVSSNTQSVRFCVQDATGRIAVDPSGASIDAVKAVDRFEPGESLGAGGTLSFGAFSISLGAGLLGQEGRRTLGYHFQESVLPLGRPVYVLGEASDSTGSLMIQHPREKGKKFIISMKSEEELVRSAESAISWMLYGAVALAVVGLVLVAVGISKM